MHQWKSEFTTFKTVTMYKFKKPKKTTLRVCNAYTAETLEQKIYRMVNNREPISDGADIIYTERSEGVKPEYDIRTDKWEHAVDAMDKVSKSKLAKREDRLAKQKEEKEGKKTDDRKVDTNVIPRASGHTGEAPGGVESGA